MKSTLCVVMAMAAILFLLLGIANSAERDFDLSIDVNYNVYQNKDLRTDGPGLRGVLGWKNIYLWGSYEQIDFRMFGQTEGNIKIYGIGPGLKVKIVDGLKVFVEGGYYIPKADLNRVNGWNEGLYYHWYGVLSEIGMTTPFLSVYDQYRYKLSSNIGGMAGAEFTQELYKGLTLNAYGAYRLLNFNENYSAYSKTEPGHLNTCEKRNFSGGQFGIGLKYIW